MTSLRGSCLGGEMRFEIDGPLMRSSHCHCRQCQKAHGAPFRTRARVVAADFRFLAGEELVSFYESTPGTHRGFCKVCGAPVLVKFDEHSRSAQTDPGAVALHGVALATLDDDSGIRPDAHAFIIDKAATLASAGVLAVLAGRDYVADGLGPIPYGAGGSWVSGRAGSRLRADHDPRLPDAVRSPGRAQVGASSRTTSR
jgi:hypothetical protein